MSNYIANEYGMIELPIDEFVDYLTPVLNAIGVETIELINPACFDRDRDYYIATTERIFFGYGNKWTKEEIFKRMAEHLTGVAKNRLYPMGKIRKIGVYKIHVQETKETDLSPEMVGIYCRCSFPKDIDEKN